MATTTVGQLTEPEVNEFKEAFSLMDTEASGVVSFKEMEKMLASIGFNAKAEEISALFADVEGPGFDFPEFLKVMGKLMPKLKRYAEDEDQEEKGSEELLKSFRVLDPKETGFVTKEQLNTALTKIGNKCTPLELNEMFGAFDTGNTGKFDYQAFVAMMTR